MKKIESNKTAANKFEAVKEKLNLDSIEGVSFRIKLEIDKR